MLCRKDSTPDLAPELREAVPFVDKHRNRVRSVFLLDPLTKGVCALNDLNCQLVSMWECIGTYHLSTSLLVNAECEDDGACWLELARLEEKLYSGPGPRFSPSSQARTHDVQYADSARLVVTASPTPNKACLLVVEPTIGVMCP